MIPDCTETIENLEKNKEYWTSKIEYYDEELKSIAK